MFRSLVGVIIVAIAIAGIAVFWWTLTATDSFLNIVPAHWSWKNGWDILYSWQAPPLFAIIAAITIALGVVLIFVGLEIRDLNLSRRSHNRKVKPLAPWILMDQTRGHFYGNVTITVLIPAHNEAALIGQTIDALMEQEPKPDRVIVVADNCIDQTAAIAVGRGVEVMESQGNKDKKAGALNQILARLLPGLGPNDTVMIMDADTRLKSGFLATAIKHFSEDRGLSAIGGLFFGEPGLGIIGQLQRNEYIRYARDIKRRHGRVFVLTGTASIFRSQALRTVAASRGTSLPGTPGDVYDVAALTEDNEITIALKSLGALMTSPSQCQVETELMPSMKTLWNQRLRWQRGALENIAAYGITSTTTKYWSQQLGIAYSVFALWSFFLLIFVQIVSTDTWVWYPFWISMFVLFIAERMFTAWNGGWRARLLAATMIPELLYDSYLDLIFLKGVFDIALRRRAKWGHEKAEAR